MKKTAYCVLFILILSVLAFAEMTPWADIWTNASYYTTNGEDKNFRAVHARSEGRFGFRMDSGSAAMPYIVYYGVYGQNPNYWNNNLAVGGGIRIMPFTAEESKNSLTEWVRDIKFYGEILSLSFLKDESTASTNKVKKDDFRFGIDVWHEWNLSKPEKKVPWAEMWSRVDYRSTNFYDPQSGIDKFQTYLAYLQLKVGRFFEGGVKPYLAGYLTMSGVKKVWLNSLYYGVGIRMEPFRDQENSPEILRKFKMYVEALGISWLAEQDAARPASDLRFGLEFTYGR